MMPSDASMVAHNYTMLLPGTGMPLNVSTAANIPTTLSPGQSKKIYYHVVLIIIYMLVLVGGSMGIVLMIRVLKANLRSWTTIAFLNLILAHLLFLLTVPFRIYYYVTDQWDFSMIFCKLVSATIHIHMYIVFAIYVVLLSVHFLHYYKKMEQMEFDRKLHAVAASIAIWSILIIIGPVVLWHYGKSHNTGQRNHTCFDFGDELKQSSAFILNVILSVVTVLVSIVLSCILAVILHSVVKKHGPASRDHQEFSAQVKNISLMFIILICLVPYQLFRLYYLQNPSMLEKENELFLAITTLTCFDMLLLFSGKGICQRCGVC